MVQERPELFGMLASVCGLSVEIPRAPQCLMARRSFAVTPVAAAAQIPGGGVVAVVVVEILGAGQCLSQQQGASVHLTT